MKKDRYYTKSENEIYIHDKPTLESSTSCSIEYNANMSDIRRLYSNFRLLKSWESLENDSTKPA